MLPTQTMISKAMRRVVAVCLWSVLFVVPVMAVAGASSMPMDQAVVPVVDESPAMLRQAMSAALSQVLVKQTGREDVLVSPSVKSQLAHAKNWVARYRYVPASVSNGQSLSLMVTFDHQGIATLLQQAGFPAWQGARDPTLLWIQRVSSPAAALITTPSVNKEVDDVMHHALVTAADARALPVVFPLKDLSDPALSSLSTANSLSPAWAQLQKRYQVKSILFALVSQDPITHQWSAAWTWHDKQSNVSWQGSATSREQLISAGLDHMVEAKVNQSLVFNQDDGPQSRSLVVTGVMDLMDYADVVAYVKDLSMVSQVSVQDMKGSSMLLKVDVKSSLMAFEKALSQDHRLYQVKSLNSRRVADHTLYFHWGPVDDPNEDASPSLSTYDDSLAALGDAHNNPTQTVPATNDLAQAPSITAPGATKDHAVTHALSNDDLSGDGWLQ